MRIEPLMIGLVIFSAVILGFSGFFSATGNEYNVTTQDISQYSQGQYLAKTSNETATEVKGITTSPSSFGWYLLSAPFTIGKDIANSTRQFTESLSSLTTLSSLGLPAWVVPLITTIVLFTISFAVLRALWGEKRL